MTEDISSYERLRLENIKRNELFLEKLDLASFLHEKVPKTRNQRVKVEVSTDNVPCRLSSRNISKAPGFFSDDSLIHMNRSKDDTDEDYTDDEKSTPKSTKRANRELTLLNDIEEPVIKMEKAKTGRSSCRKCRENIDQDTMRVGMKAWIMGRSSW